VAPVISAVAMAAIVAHRAAFGQRGVGAVSRAVTRGRTPGVRKPTVGLERLAAKSCPLGRSRSPPQFGADGVTRMDPLAPRNPLQHPVLHFVTRQ